VDGTNDHDEQRNKRYYKYDGHGAFRRGLIVAHVFLAKKRVLELSLLLR
jgi:hypothetical protein